MPLRGLVSLLLLLLLGLAGTAPLSRQEVTRCLEEALQDKLSPRDRQEGPCMQLFQEDERLTSLLQTLEGLRHQEISKHHLSPEPEAEREEQEEAEEEDFRKKKRGHGEAEGEKTQGQEVREEEEEEEEVKAKGKSEIRVQEGKGQPRAREEEEEDQGRKRRGPAQEELAEAWDRGLEKRVVEKASDEETAQFEEEEKGVKLSRGGHSLWQGAGPAHRPPYSASRPEQEEEQEHRELERLEQMGDELKRAAEVLSKRG